MDVDTSSANLNSVLDTASTKGAIPTTVNSLKLSLPPFCLIYPYLNPSFVSYSEVSIVPDSKLVFTFVSQEAVPSKLIFLNILFDDGSSLTLKVILTSSVVS